MEQKEKKLFLFDAMSLIFRAYYALNKNPRLTSKGLNTSAILGFTNTLYEVIKAEKPTHMAVAFDSHGPTVRHADFEQYKANRDATPEDIVASLPYIDAILDAFNIPILRLSGYEADDIIGTFAKKAEQQGFTTYMMTTDKDYGQLVSENIFIYKPAHKGSEISILGVKEICEKYSINEPEQLIDILGLWGDAVDNIPGIKGIGEVGAKNLIKQFGSIENMIANVDLIRNEKLKQKVKDGSEDAILSKSLATIILDVPIEFDEQQLKFDKPDVGKLKKIFDELEFRTLYQRIIKDFNLEQTTTKPTTFSDSLFPDLFSQSINNSLNSNKTYNQITNIQELAKFIEDIKTKNCFAFIPNIKINIDQSKSLLGLAFCTEKDKATYVQLPDRKEALIAWLNILEEIFTNKQEKITYELKNSIKIFHTCGMEIQNNCFDTILAHYILEPEARHNIENLSDNYLHSNLMYASNNDFWYFCEQADIVFQLKPVFAKLMEEREATKLFNEIEMPLVAVLAEMEETGVKIDIDCLKNYSIVLDERISAIKKDIYAMAGEEFNIGSPKQLGIILFEKLRIIDNAKLTKSKQYQTGEDILIKLENKHPIISKILEFRGLSKLKSTYVDAFTLLVNKKTGRLHTQFNQTVTATGRLSSSNPNLQNIPIRDEDGREIRKAFVPSNPQYTLIAADYSQIELRLAAVMSHDENMLNDFMHNVNIHAATSARIYNVDITDVTKDMRRHAKAVNFGILYGMSAFGLAERLNISRTEAAQLIEQYFEKFPSIKDYINQQIEFAQNHGYVETIMKRRRYLRNINSKNNNLRSFDQRNAVNAPIQGTAADLIKIAMINIYRDLKNNNLKAKIILQVHDELVLDVPLDEVEKVKEIVNKNMTTVINMPIPLSIDMKCGQNWLEAH